MHNKHCIHIDKELIKQWKSEKRGNKTNKRESPERQSIIR
jgi:hypothetical protein